MIQRSDVSQEMLYSVGPFPIFLTDRVNRANVFTGGDGEIRYGVNHGMSRGGSEAVREMRGEINVSKGENIQCSE